MGALIVAALVFFVLGDRIGLRSASPVEVNVSMRLHPRQIDDVVAVGLS